MIINYIHWNPDSEIVNLFGVSIRYYGLLFTTGLILSVFLLKWIFDKENIPQENLDKLTIYGIVGIFAGARLGHCLFYEFSYYMAHPLEMFLPIVITPEGVKFIGYQGLASHGGALGLIIALILYSHKTKNSIIKTIDLIAVTTPVAATFIRLGNLMNSEIIGIPTTKPWAFIFIQVDNTPRHPAQLYEAISYLLIFAVMIIAYLKMRTKIKNGFFFGLVLTLIFTMRFLIEFVKENQVAFEDIMTINMGQALSIPYILIGLGFMVFSYARTFNAEKRV